MVRVARGHLQFLAQARQLAGSWRRRTRGRRTDPRMTATRWSELIAAHEPTYEGAVTARSFAIDAERQNVAAYAVFHGTHTGEGGPVPPTGKSASTDYVYVMDFAGGRIRHMTKIWNDGWALRQLGWTS